MIRDSDYKVRAQYGDMTVLVDIDKYGAHPQRTAHRAKHLAERILRSKLWARAHGYESVDVPRPPVAGD